MNQININIMIEMIIEHIVELIAKLKIKFEMAYVVKRDSLIMPQIRLIERNPQSLLVAHSLVARKITNSLNRYPLITSKRLSPT